jgi:hypothetical protein
MKRKIDRFQVLVGPVEEKNTVLNKTAPNIVKILSELLRLPLIIKASDTDDSKDNCKRVPKVNRDKYS